MTKRDTTLLRATGEHLVEIPLTAAEVANPTADILSDRTAVFKDITTGVRYRVSAAGTTLQAEAAWSDSAGTALVKPDGTTTTLGGGGGVTGITSVAVLAGNTAAANGAIIAAAMTAATEGSTLQFPEGTFSTTTITLAKVFIWRGVGRQATVLTCPSGDLMTLTGSSSAFGMVFEAMTMRSDNGHVINQTGRLSAGVMRDVRLKSTGSNKSCWKGSGASILLLDFVWDNVFFEKEQDGSMFDIVLAGTGGTTAFNACSFIRCRFENVDSTSPSFRAECTGAGNYNYDINFADCNFENATSGAIYTYGAQGWILNGVRCYDTGTFLQDVFTFGSSGERSNTITLIGSGRVSGGLTGGKFDINATNADNVLAINCTSLSTTLATTGKVALLEGGRFTNSSTQTITFNATTMAVNFASGIEVTFGTLTANVTAMSAPSNIPAANTECHFHMLQDATGGRTFTWHSKFTGTTWPTGSGTANQRQIVTGVSNGTNIAFQSSSGWFTPT
jgi:hypothetical protein